MWGGECGAEGEFLGSGGEWGEDWGWKCHSAGVRGRGKRGGEKEGC